MEPKVKSTYLDLELDVDVFADFVPEVVDEVLAGFFEVHDVGHHDFGALHEAQPALLLEDGNELAFGLIGRAEVFEQPFPQELPLNYL